MKLNLDSSISLTPLTLETDAAPSDVPEIARQLVAMESVKSVFLMNDFITLTRKPSADWQPILAAAAQLIGLSQQADANLAARVTPIKHLDETGPRGPNLGQVDVAVQAWRGIPVQVRATAADGQQARVGLPEQFGQVLQRAIGATQADYVQERRWEAYPPQFGPPQEVAQRVAEEIVSLMDAEELMRLEREAIADVESAGSQHSQAALLKALKSTDWKQRLKALQRIDVNSATFPAVAAALRDENNAIRRWAAAILGASEMAEAAEPLCDVVLGDRSAIVRRIAGDALSDLGDPKAIPTFCQALSDSSPLVRWRAARFLTERGDPTAVESLQQAIDCETEFDVRLEMEAALERIETGGAAQLPMWMRISQGAK